MSIAKALNRKFDVLSLTKFPSLVADIKKGRHSPLIDSLIATKSMNPVILLDEIDKVEDQMSFLNILDPVQNRDFKDEQLGINVDLSHVFFVCTANDINQLGGPLVDRMKVIEFESYLIEEKIEITK